MRGMYGGFVVVAACALAGSAGASHLAAGRAPDARLTGSKLVLATPPAGDVVLGVVKLHSRSGAPAKLRLAHPPAGVIVIAVIHTQKTAKGSVRTFLFIVANRGQRALAATKTPPPPPDLDEGQIEFIHQVWNTDRVIYRRPEMVSVFWEWWNHHQAEKHKRELLKQEKEVFEEAPKWEPAVTEASTSDTVEWFDSAHEYGWKLKNREVANAWGDYAHGSDLDAVITKIQESLDNDGPDGPATTPIDPNAYTCTGASQEIDSNWNADAEDPGAQGGPTLSTKGKAYCLDWLATYHYNKGKGAPPGTITLVGGGQTLGPYKAVGQDGQGGVPNANWVATVPSAPKVVISGSYTCKDSDPATWAQNDRSHHLGFCKMWGREATKTG